MKKTLKAIVAAMLAAIMALGSLSAFAAETHEELEWNYYGETYYYEYAGELKEGTNAVGESIGDLGYVYFTANIETAGYYMISYSYDDFDSWAGIPDRIEDGIAYDEKETLRNIEDSVSTEICFFETGENIIAFDVYSASDDSVVNFEFWGEEVTSVSIPEEAIIDCNFYYSEEDNGTTEISLYYDITVTFDEGKTIETDYIYGTADKIKIGEQNAFALNICGKEYEAAITLYEISRYVSDVSLSSTDVTQYYDGYEVKGYDDLVLTVVFTDGTTQTVNVNGYYEDCLITLPNGYEAYPWVYYHTYRDEIKAAVYFDDALVKEIECNKISTSVSENFDRLKENIYYYFNDFSYYLDRAETYFVWAFESLTYAFTEIFDLISYYLF